jgi:hypothetical protein
MSNSSDTVARAYQINGKLGNMDAFDRLPKAVREALRNSDHNWSAAQCLSELRKPKARRRIADAQALVAFVTEQDRKAHERGAAAGLVCPGQR